MQERLQALQMCPRKILEIEAAAEVDRVPANGTGDDRQGTDRGVETVVADAVDEIVVAVGIGEVEVVVAIVVIVGVDLVPAIVVMIGREIKLEKETRNLLIKTPSSDLRGSAIEVKVRQLLLMWSRFRVRR